MPAYEFRALLAGAGTIGPRLCFSRMSSEDATLAVHYREQALRLRLMAANLPGEELKTLLLDAARLYERLAEQLEGKAL